MKSILSKWTQAFSKDFQRLRSGRPGRRFREFVRHRGEGAGDDHRISRSQTILLGVGLVMTGTAIGWLPGPGGFLALVGFAVLATEIPWVAGWLDRFELAARKSLRRLSRSLWTPPRR